MKHNLLFFATAFAFFVNEGRSESSFGEAIIGIPRDRLLIGTKVSPSNCYKRTLIEHCEASLRRLQTDYIDIYMVHWPIHPHLIRHFIKDIRIIENLPEISEVQKTFMLVGSRNISELEVNAKAIHRPLSKEIKSELDWITLPVMEKLGNHFDYYESAENDRTI